MDNQLDYEDELYLKFHRQVALARKLVPVAIVLAFVVGVLVGFHIGSV